MPASVMAMLRKREVTGQMSKYQMKLLLCKSGRLFTTKPQLSNLIQHEADDLKRLSEIASTLTYRQVFGNGNKLQLMKCPNKTNWGKTIVLVSHSNTIDVYIGSACYRDGKTFLLSRCTARVYDECEQKVYRCDNLTRVTIKLMLQNQHAVLEAAGRPKQLVQSNQIVIIKGSTDFVV